LQALEKKGPSPGDRLAESRRQSQMSARSASHPKNTGGEVTPDQHSRRPSIQQDDRRLVNLESAVEHLEHKVDQRLRDIGSAQSTRQESKEVPRKRSNPPEVETYSLLADYSHRLGIVEAKLEESSKTNVHHQLVELHRQQTEAHHEMLKIKIRFDQLEEAEKQRALMDGKQLEVQSRLHKLENGSLEANEQLEEAQKLCEKELKHNVHSIERVDKNLGMLIKYVTGEDVVPGESDESRPATTDSRGEWKLAWLEKRIEGLVKRKGGLNLESRLRALEQGNKMPRDLPERTKKLEAEFASLDIKDLTQVRPDLNQHRKIQEVISNNLQQELKELKCLVGCVEACIPRETRKAVQLFKRAAGANEGDPMSPREFHVDSKILQLREEMQVKIEGASNRLEDGREHMQQIVRGIERKQDLLDAKLSDVKALVSRPGSIQGPFDASSAASILALPPLQELQIRDAPSDVLASVAPPAAMASEGCAVAAQPERAPAPAPAQANEAADPGSKLGKPPPGWK